MHLKKNVDLIDRNKKDDANICIIRNFIICIPTKQCYVKK